MMHLMTELNTCIGRKAGAVARWNTRATHREKCSETLELQRLWQVYEEIQRRFTNRLAALEH
jgi:hypothetical protein